MAARGARRDGRAGRGLEGFLALAGSSYAVLIDDAPGALILMFNMTAPMLLWMRVRGHDAGEVSEMGVAMVVPLKALGDVATSIAASLFGPLIAGASVSAEADATT